MSLEKTVLSIEKIKELLNINYGISVSSVQKMNLGTANCYKVNDGEKNYFLKEFQSDFSREDLMREAKLVNYLADQGIPTAKYIETISKQMFIEFEGHLICLEEYIEGKTYGYDDFPKALMLQSAGMLGMIHKCLIDYELPIDMGKEWLDSFSEDKEQHKYSELMDVLANHKSDKNYEKIKEDLIYKQKLLSDGNDFIKYFEGITYAATHGDYQGCQLICEDEHIKAVIDFSSARRLPVIWEIMRSYVQSSEYCRKEAKIDVDGLCEYVEEYMKYSTLTLQDLQSMPYVYLFQLARSRYGYPQYLLTNSDDRDGLLKFAFWRTDMCREVESKAGEIATRLVKLKNKKTP